MSPSCHTLSKAIDMYINTPLTSKPLSKEVKILRVIDRSSFTQELPGLKADCLREIRLLSKKYSNMLSYMMRKKNLLGIVRPPAPPL